MIVSYLKSIGANILEKNVDRSEVTYVITLPSSIGEQAYLAKAKDKKNLNENDLSKFYIEALSKKMPLLLIVSKDLSRKVKEYSKKNFGSLSRIVVLK